MSSLADVSEPAITTPKPPSAPEIVRHLAHELRQPLSAIESIAFCLSAHMEGRDSEIHGHLDRLQQLVEHANWVLTDVVHFLELSAPKPGECDCNAVLEEIFEEAWAGEGLEIFFEPDPDLPRAWADEEQLCHLMRSMLQFFSRYASEPRQLYLATVPAGTSIAVTATARVVGVNVETLFAPLSPQQLLTCRLIAERCGGRFAASPGESGDLTLRCELPAATA